MIHNKDCWHNKTENIWICVSVILGFLNLLLISFMWNRRSPVENLDSLSVSITVLEIFLVIVAFSGFWMIKTSAESKAQDHAEYCAEKIAREIAAKEARSATEKWLTLRFGDNQTDRSALKSMLDSLDKG